MSDSFETTAPFEDPRFANQDERDDDAFVNDPFGDGDSDEEPRRGCGCLGWGCLIAVLLMLGLIVAALAASYYGSKWVVENLSDEQPADIAVVELPEEQLAALGERIERLQAAVKAAPDEPPPEDLVLTEEEINGLIAQDPDLRGRAFVRLRAGDGGPGQIGADLSIPTDGLPFGFGKGRFVNATVWFDVEFDGEEVSLQLAEAEFNGRPIDAQLLARLSGVNLLEEATDSPEVARLIARYDTLEIRDGELTLRARRPLDKQAPSKPGQDEAPPIDLAPGL